MLRFFYDRQGEGEGAPLARGPRCFSSKSVPCASPRSGGRWETQPCAGSRQHQRVFAAEETFKDAILVLEVQCPRRYPAHPPGPGSPFNGWMRTSDRPVLWGVVVGIKDEIAEDLAHTVGIRRTPAAGFAGTSSESAIGLFSSVRDGQHIGDHFLRNSRRSSAWGERDHTSRFDAGNIQQVGHKRVEAFDVTATMFRKCIWFSFNAPAAPMRGYPCSL
jgi:hypothetical protein